MFAAVEVFDSVVLNGNCAGKTTVLAARRQRGPLRGTPSLLGVLRAERALLTVVTYRVALGGHSGTVRTVVICRPSRRTFSKLRVC